MPDCFRLTEITGIEAHCEKTGSGIGLMYTFLERAVHLLTNTGGVH